MNCYNHPNVPATATCADCGAPICAACTRMLGGKPFCPADYALARFDEGEIARPAIVPAYQPEKNTEHIPLQHEQLALVEKYKGPTNFLYSRAANSGIQPQQTAEVLAQYEDTRAVIDAGRSGEQDRTLRWAVIGLICAIAAAAALVLATAGISNQDLYYDASIATAIPAIFSVISAVLIFHTIYTRENSNHPRRIIWAGIAGLIILVAFWIFAAFWLHQRDQYITDLLRQQFPGLYK